MKMCLRVSSLPVPPTLTKMRLGNCMAQDPRLFVKQSELLAVLAVLTALVALAVLPVLAALAVLTALVVLPALAALAVLNLARTTP